MVCQVEGNHPDATTARPGTHFPLLSRLVSGSVFWFFVLLNYVKEEDLAGCSTSCASLLTTISRQLQDRLTPLEALLQTRYATVQLRSDLQPLLACDALIQFISYSPKSQTTILPRRALQSVHLRHRLSQDLTSTTKTFMGENKREKTFWESNR